MRQYLWYGMCCILFVAAAENALANAQNQVTVKEYGTFNDSAGTVHTWIDPRTGDTVTSVRAPKSAPATQGNIPIYIYPQVEPYYSPQGQHPPHLGPGPHTPVAPIPPSPYEPMPIEGGNP